MNYIYIAMNIMLIATFVYIGLIVLYAMYRLFRDW